MKTFDEWIQDEQEPVFSVTRDIEGKERFDPKRTEVIFDGLSSENEAWKAGHDWLMEQDMPYVALDIRKNGAVVGMVSWEP